MIRNIVFDIGGVLADFRLKEFLAEKGFDGEQIRRILKASVLSPCWMQFERGELTEEEALQGFARLDPEIEGDLRRAYANVAGMLTGRAYAIPLIRHLKAAGYRVFYLSNYSKKAYDECGESLGFMPYMDGGLVSFRAGRTKPDPEMYRMFLKEYALEAEECLFVDDTRENVQVARSLGFSGIVFEDEEKLLEAFRRHGVCDRIYLAGGCFWGVEKYFDQFDGVIATQVGYANGPQEAPSYQEVCASSGHAETVRVDYDPRCLPLEKLLERYFMVIDPLSVNQQGHDRGIQYRTGIYYLDEAQLIRARAVYEAEEKKAGQKLAVELAPLQNFFPAEEYHQKYLDKNPGGYCHIPRAMLQIGH